MPPVPCGLPLCSHVSAPTLSLPSSCWLSQAHLRITSARRPPEPCFHLCSALPQHPVCSPIARGRDCTGLQEHVSFGDYLSFSRSFPQLQKSCLLVFLLWLSFHPFLFLLLKTERPVQIQAVPLTGNMTIEKLPNVPGLYFLYLRDVKGHAAHIYFSLAGML